VIFVSLTLLCISILFICSCNAFSCILISFFPSFSHTHTHMHAHHSKKCNDAMHRTIFVSPKNCCELNDLFNIVIFSKSKETFSTITFCIMEVLCLLTVLYGMSIRNTVLKITNNKYPSSSSKIVFIWSVFVRFSYVISHPLFSDSVSVLRWVERLFGAPSTHVV